jgi:hypothetical protein
MYHLEGAYLIFMTSKTTLIPVVRATGLKNASEICRGAKYGGKREGTMDIPLYKLLMDGVASL